MEGPSGADGRVGVTVRLFASAREAAGTGRMELRARTLAEALERLVEDAPAPLAAVLAGCQVWINGEPSGPGAALAEGDEVAVLPPVSGG